MTKRTAAMVVLGVLACGEPVEDGQDQAVDHIDVAAPLAFELAPAAQLVLEDATVAGIGHGTVIIDALAIDASAGVLLELPLAERATALWLAGPKDARRSVAAARAPELAADAHAVEAQLVALELGGFEAAWLVDVDGQRVALAEPLVVDAGGLAWTAGELVVIELADDESASAGAASTGARAHARARTPAVAPQGDADELAHARRQDGGVDPLGDLVADHDPIALEPGDPCSATAQCPIETRCVADPMQSDGQVRCLALCVEPELVGGGMPPVPSPSATCVDDDGCCDPDLACSNGQCEVVAPTDDDGGDDDDDGSSSGGGCDRDDDGWVNGCDRKPDESCIHDADDDGCNDSFDDNDDDACDCTTPRVPRPNSTGIALLLLVWLRGRKRR